MDYSDVLSMSVTRPPNASPYEDERNNSILPLASTGLNSQNSPTNTRQYNQNAYRLNSPIFPPTHISHLNSIRLNTPSSAPPLPPTNIYNPPVNHTVPRLPNLYNPIISNNLNGPLLPPQPVTTATGQNQYHQRTIRPMYPTPPPVYHAQTRFDQNLQQAQSTGSASYQPPNSSLNSGSIGSNSSNSINATNQQINTNGNNSLILNNVMKTAIDLLRERNVITPFIDDPPISPLLNDENKKRNCSSEVMRCTLNVIPQTNELLNKSRLPFGLVIHPFRDLENLNVMQDGLIIRCQKCKSYINPCVAFIDNTKWRCSICNRVNDVQGDYFHDLDKRLELHFGTIEYIANSDYMARSPPPAIYLFLLDVSSNAIHTGYIQAFCDILFDNLNEIPGDKRTKIGFIAYDSRIHLFDLSDRQNGTFRMMIVPDIDNVENKFDEFLPIPDGLLVTLDDCRTTIETFLTELPKIYQHSSENDSALGTALLVAGNLLSSTGGRVTVFQTRIPNTNPGALNVHTGKEPTVIAPTSDYYKKLALEYASSQIACDLFVLSTHYIDLATLSCISKYSGGEVKYYPNFHASVMPNEKDRFQNDLRRYLQRKIGFEAILRLRLPSALSIHTFYGNGFVRSVDSLVLPNINPDAGFGIQLTIEDSLARYKSVTFQVALLYTSSNGERRIRIHTLSLPVSVNLIEICANGDQQAIASMIAKMAADRSMTSSIQEAREGLKTVARDIVKAALLHKPSNREHSLILPRSLCLIPLYMLGMIKSMAFRSNNVSRIDDRAYYIDICKTLPTEYLIQIFYPNLYPIHTIEDKNEVIQHDNEELNIPKRLQLSFQFIDPYGAYLLDVHEHIYIYIGKGISEYFLQNVFNVQTYSALPYDSYSLPELDNPLSVKIHNFVTYLIQNRSNGVAIHIMREDSSNRHIFYRYFVDDKSESDLSYIEFLRYVREQTAN